MAEATGVAKLIELAKDIHITMFTTVDSEGHFVSRPMAQHLVEPDGDLWFFAERIVMSSRAADRPRRSACYSFGDGGGWMRITDESAFQRIDAFL